ncbi:hypothetical protein J2T55_002135 [Methylohalomonas lacus]|uniref:Uncharacterized protein n=1 Tax=Methylohalomonas lacus TaxID=398773 RepID=A0AAE3HMX7_9GAMM|nr:hypothetical protein [Methylohalomonas lacus]MCS3904102.1 hypothetical protein [Methylohalomonas lacus]
MEASQTTVGTMVKTNSYVHGVPPETLGVICEVTDTDILVAWYLCDKPLPNLTPQSIAELPEDDPQCPLRDRLSLESEVAYIDPA